MNGDNIGRLAKSDPLITSFAEKLTGRLGHDRDQAGYIRQRLRELSRMVLAYREITGKVSAQLTDLIYPEEFANVIAATKKAAGFDEKTNLYKTPTLSLKIGHGLQTCVQILKGKALVP